MVAAPSKLQRPSGDRVKTDARDARQLARLLQLGEIVAVDGAQRGAGGGPGSGPGPRGRPRGSDAARHRLSKLLLRQGIVYSGGQAVDRRARAVAAAAARSTAPGLQLAFDTAYDTMLATVDRRDRLDAAITAMAADSEFTPVVTRLGCLRGVSTLTAFGLAVEIGDWHRLTGRSIGAYLGLVPTESSSGATRSQGVDHQDRQRPRPPAAGRGGLAPPHALPARARTLRRRWEPAAPAARAPRPAGQPAAARPLGSVRRPPANAPWSPTSRSPANWPAGAGRWPSSTTNTPQTVRMTITRWRRQRLGATRDTTYEQSRCTRNWMTLDL